MPAPSEGLEARRQLELLQEELQALKGRWGRALRLQRATPAEAPATAPFPIVLTFQVEPPPAAAAHYDVSAVRIQIRLSRAALQLPQWAAAGGGSGAGAVTHGSVPPRALPPGTDLTVLSDELPRLLRSKMQAQLAKVWLDALGNASGAAAAGGGTGGSSGDGSTPPSVGPYKLSVPASHMQERFVPLICLVPELVEPYQAENEHGATVRRYAIVNTDGGAGSTEDGGGSCGDEAPGVGASPAGGAHADSPAGGGAGDGGASGRGPIGASGSSGRGAGTSGSAAALAAAASLGASTSSTGIAAAPAAPAATAPAAAAAGTTGRIGVGAAAAPAGPAEPLTHGSVPQGAQRIAPNLDAAVGLRDAPPPTPAQPPDPASVTRGSGGAAARFVAGSASAGGGSEEIPEAPSPSEAAPAKAGSSQLRLATAAASAPAAAVGLSATGASLSSVTQLEGRILNVARDPEPANQNPAAAAAAAAPPHSSPPPGLLSYTVAHKELQYIQKRYSQVFSARVHRDADPSAAAAGAGGAGAPHSLLQPGCLTTFELELLPTDPDWDMPPVRVVGQLLPVSASAYLPSLGVHMASRLPAWLRAALEAHMAEQLAAQAEEEEARAAAAAAELPPPSLHGGRGPAVGRGPGGPAGRGGRGGRLSYSGGAGAGGASGQQDAEVAPAGTVLLPLGSLRNLFRDLENYAGAVARAADEERRRRERDAAAAASDDGGGSGSSGGEGEEGGDGSRYDDDGYGDGSHRREGDDDGDEYDSAGEGSTGSDDGTAADEVRFSGTAAAATSGAEAPAAYAVLLEGLQLDNLAAVEVLRANFEVSCGRCRARDTAVLASAAVAGGGGSGASHQATASGCCQRCTAPWSLVMRPHFVHATSNSLCVIKPQGCRPLDLLPSLMAGQCGECSAVMTLRDVQVGLPFSRNCSSCHKELSMSVAAVSFVPRGPPRGGGGAAAGRGASRTRRARADAGGGGGGGTGGLRPGQPLPALGTCKHYRHSYRWLRFPCCGMRFPCDLCHEEAVPDGHPVRWAQRMVCGFCSTEQHLALACRACGRQLAGTAANPSGRRTRFWEGGTGCRDPRRLDRNDPHKWRGRNKTVSAKQSRVGPKPWSGKAGGGGGAGGAG